MATSRRGDLVKNLAETVHQYLDETRFLVELSLIHGYLKGALDQSDVHQLIWYNSYDTCEPYFNRFVKLVDEFTMEKVISHLVWKELEGMEPSGAEQQYDAHIKELVSAYEMWKSDDVAMEEYFDNNSETWVRDLEPNYRVCGVLRLFHRISPKPLNRRLRIISTWHENLPPIPEV